MNRRRFLTRSILAAGTLAVAPSLVTGCTANEAEGVLNTVINSALAVLKVVEPAASWLPSFAGAIAALQQAETLWKAGGAVNIVESALATLEAVTAAIPVTAVYSPLIDILVAGIDTVLGLLHPAQPASALAGTNSHRGRASLSKPHFLQTRVGAYKSQWNDAVKANPALAAAKL